MTYLQMRNKKTLKRNCFLVKAWASRHTKCISPPYSRS